jgi:hypothetical protein
MTMLVRPSSNLSVNRLDENRSIANIPNAVYRGQLAMSYVLVVQQINNQPESQSFFRIVDPHLPCHNENNKSKITLLKLEKYSRASQFDFHFG